MSCRHCRFGLRLCRPRVVGGLDGRGVLAVEDLGDRPQGLVGPGTVGGQRSENEHHGSGKGGDERHAEPGATGAARVRAHRGVRYKIGADWCGCIRFDVSPPLQQRLDELSISGDVERRLWSIGSACSAADRIQQQIVPPHRNQRVDVEIVLAEPLVRVVRIGQRALRGLPIRVERFRH